MNSEEIFSRLICFAQYACIQMHGQLDVTARVLQTIKRSEFLFASVVAVGNVYPIWGQLLSEADLPAHTVDYAVSQVYQRYKLVQQQQQNQHQQQ